MKRGEVWWLAEPPKRRPVCILTRDEAIPVLSRVLIAPATTRIRGLPTEVELDQSDGMPAACVLSIDNIRVVPKRQLRSLIAELPPARMARVCEALGLATACW